MAVRRAPENGVHRAGPGECLAAEFDESAEPLVWVRERADLVPAVVLVVLRGVLRVGSGHRQDAFQQALLPTEGDVDRIGSYGHSPAPSEPASIAAHARRCGELLRGLGVTRAHWVGHSSSCCIGLQLALDDPGLVASLILVGPAKPSGKQRELAASTYVGPALAAAAQGDVSRAFDVFLRGVGGDGYREVLRARLGDDGLVEAERESAYFFANELPALAAWTFGPAEAARVVAPALLICGAESRPWFRENVAILAAMLPNARMPTTLPELDHLAPLTRPAELASAISEFVSRDAHPRRRTALDNTSHAS
jgi:pimeloyl-ACP methyl ester carboxylesterase